MYTYLSKKIAIPNGVRLNCVSWNKTDGYIAVGGDDGMVKVLKLEQATNPMANGAAPSSASVGGLAAQSNLSMNQTLEGHKTNVRVVTWNNAQQKLTSSDVNGVIMVWMLYKGSWYEEMTNDRKKSSVNAMTWSSDGDKICIVYSDGAIIVGSVDGNRLWGKELKNTILTGAQWSPDNRLLLFSLSSGECHLYDNQGNFLMKLNIQCVSLSASRLSKVTGLCWFSGRVPTGRPVLAVSYENGQSQIMRNENDDDPIIFNTHMENISSKWNKDGTILAICGKLFETTATVSVKDVNQVLFFSANGSLLRALKIPGNSITSISWDGLSLRLAMTVDSFIFFANIRPQYKWCYIARTVVFLNIHTHLEHSNTVGMQVLTFWDTSSNHRYLKEIETVIAMSGFGEHCVIAVECSSINISKDSNGNQKKYQLMICNSIGTTVDATYVDLKPEMISMNSSYVVIASGKQFLVWHFHTPRSSSTLHEIRARKDKVYYVDDNPSTSNDESSKKDSACSNDDPICAVSMSEKILLVARESGCINEYTVPMMILRSRHRVNGKTLEMGVNCNSSRAAIVDTNGVMILLDLDEVREGHLNFNQRVERKDVWQICWAKDNPLLLAFMEKTRMYVFRGNDPEEPIASSGYICTFEDLEITSVLLDDIIAGNETPNPSAHLVQLRVRSLRDTESLLENGIEDAKNFIEDNPHPRLWRLLAEYSLKKLDFDTAENAFVRCSNYPGIQLVKRLRSITSENLQRAEIYSFFGEFELAEKLYMDADRRDLAVDLRSTLCDWFRVVQLYRLGTGTSDQQLEKAWQEIGKHFANLNSWESAKEYYQKSHDMEGLIDALYHLEQYDELYECVGRVPEKSPLLPKIALMLGSVGMCEEAVKAYLKFGDYKSAVSVCVNLKQWGQAVELAQQFKMPQINTLLAKHATQLLQDGHLPEAVELQRKAGKYLEAALLLTKLADQEIKKKSEYLRIKKIYVLAGILTEDFIRSQHKNLRLNKPKDRTDILSELSMEDANLIQNIWHCAEAYHFMLLAQRQLVHGTVHSAVITSLRLREYEDVLPAEDIYSMLALTSCADRALETCSKAFIKLESLESIELKKQRDYEELAVSIFAKNEPVDKQLTLTECYSCSSHIADSYPACPNCGVRFPACITSGKPLTQPLNVWMCNSCFHCACPTEISRHRTCPLCHSAISQDGFK